MLKFEIKVRKIKFNDRGFADATRSHTNKIFIKAGFAFLQTMESIVPLWSGHARSAFKPFGSVVGYTFKLTPRKDKGRGLGEEGGMRDAINANMAGTRITDYVRNTKNTMTLRIATKVPHHLTNEKEDVNLRGFKLKNPGPWNSFEHSSKAAMKVFKEEYRFKFPKLRDWVSYENPKTET